MFHRNCLLTVKNYILLYIVLVCLAIFAAEYIIQCTESCIDTHTKQILIAGVFRVFPGHRKKIMNIRFLQIVSDMCE
jgi:prolipoprotein diacylglyceryltransferase